MRGIPKRLDKGRYPPTRDDDGDDDDDAHSTIFVAPVAALVARPSKWFGVVPSMLFQMSCNTSEQCPRRG